MKQTVHILATVRNQSLWHAALLVFKTIRIGFPRATVCIWGNGLGEAGCDLMGRAAAQVDGVFKNIPATTHGKWIETLLFNANEPFWICDTDVVFFENMDKAESGKAGNRKQETLFSGRYEPEFMEEWTGTRHMARLHPSLMWFNPAPLRAALRSWPGVPEFFGTVKRNFFEWEFVPKAEIGKAGNRKQEVLFYDTCAGLYHAFGGTEFTEKQNDAFEHLHCGTYSDLIGKHLSLAGPMSDNHRAIFMQPEISRGLRHQQAIYYNRRKPIK